MSNKMDRPLVTVDGRTLMDRPLEPPNFVVDTLISQGLHKKPPTACMRQRVHCVRGIQFRRNAIYGRSYETGHRPGAGRKKYFRLKNRFA